MRILIAHEALAGGGGVESYLHSVIPSLKRRGHEVAVLHFNPEAQQGPTRLVFPDIPTIGVADLGLGEAMQRVRGWQPDVAFVHNMRHLAVDGHLAAQAPVVKMMHGYFGTCISGQKCHLFPGATPCSRVFGAACLTLYLPRRCGQMRPLRMLEGFEWAGRQRQLFARYASLIVASRHMADEYVRNGVGADRVTVAPLFPTIPGCLQPRIRPTEPTVLFAGRMTDLKGPRLLVSAVAEATARLGRPVQLVLAGEGPQRESLVRLAETLGVPVSLPGWLTGSELVALMRRSTVVAVPSVWPEPFGLVGLEAAVHGVPAVGFDIGGIPEWLHDGVNGRLVRETGDARAFGRALAEVIGDERLLAALERGALDTAAAMSIDVHLDIVERVLHAAHARRALPT